MIPSPIASLLVPLLRHRKKLLCCLLVFDLLDRPKSGNVSPELLGEGELQGLGDGFDFVPMARRSAIDSIAVDAVEDLLEPILRFAPLPKHRDNLPNALGHD